MSAHNHSPTQRICDLARQLQDDLKPVFTRLPEDVQVVVLVREDGQGFHTLFSNAETDDIERMLRSAAAELRNAADNPAATDDPELAQRVTFQRPQDIFCCCPTQAQLNAAMTAWAALNPVDRQLQFQQVDARLDLLSQRLKDHAGKLTQDDAIELVAVAERWFAHQVVYSDGEKYLRPAVPSDSVPLERVHMPRGSD